MSRMNPSLDFRNTNSLWASVFVEALVRCGVKHAVISPGSRSTPLTVAMATHDGIEAVPVLDERSAGFFALGIARRTRMPVVLICTSGTAAANYYPAVIEASESGAPLLVVTADRPPELRDCASGQTIDQQKLYGQYPKFYHELAVPGTEIELLRYLRQTVVHACERTMSPGFGPVHLNAPFRDPLPPVPDGSVEHLKGVLDDGFFDHLERVAPPIRGIVAWQRPTTTRGLIIAGQVPTSEAKAHVEAVRNLAEGLAWPVLVDVLSPVRHHGTFEVPIVAEYDAILRNDRVARELLPRTVICLGGLPTSKELRRWLEGSGAEVLMVSESPENLDSLHGRTRHVPLPVEALMPEGKPVADEGYLRAWSAASKSAREIFDRSMAVETAMFEGKVSRLLADNLPTGTAVFVANSMPVRYAEYFWPVTNRAYSLFYNRGANGIDGTLSTAMGIAHGGDPAVLLTGDLALLHDANGFLNAKRVRGSLTIIVINNGGGGIFEHLPVAKFDPPFEEFFATPQSVDFAKLCDAHGIEHNLITDWKSFETAVTVLPESGVRVLEVVTDRKADVGCCRDLLRAAARATKTA